MFLIWSQHCHCCFHLSFSSGIVNESKVKISKRFYFSLMLLLLCVLLKLKLLMSSLVNTSNDHIELSFIHAIFEQTFMRFSQNKTRNFTCIAIFSLYMWFISINIFEKSQLKSYGIILLWTVFTSLFCNRILAHIMHRLLSTKLHLVLGNVNQKVV